MVTPSEVERYYATPGVMTSAGRYRARFDELQPVLSELCRTVQGLLIHRNWVDHYGAALDEERMLQPWLRDTATMLGVLLEHCDQPLAVPRNPSDRLVVICRHFATLL